MGGSRKMISMAACRKRLATFWFLGSGILFAVLIVQSVSGKYGDKVEDAWGWLLPTMMPTLSLIAGVLVTSHRDGPVDQYTFWLAFGLSIAYLAAVAFTVCVQPLVRSDPLELFKLSHLWLGPLQGLVAGVLGFFFVKGEQSAK